MTTFLRKRRLVWYDHVLRRKVDDTTNKMLNIQVQVKRRRRPKKRMLDNIRDDMKLQSEKCVTHDDKGWPITTRGRPIGEKVRGV